MNAHTMTPSGPSTSVQHDCIDPEPSETVSTRINALLRTSGPGHTIRLCPRKRYLLDQPLVFGAENQEICTLGYPTGDDRATLVVSGPSGEHSVAVDGTRPGCAGSVLRNVQIDGNRGSSVPAREGSGANIVMGGVNDHQVVEYVRSYNPRGWSCLHVTEGPLSCRNATIQNNDIGPCGVDIEDEWADGISISCQDSVVRGNRVHNPSDGGIVVFSPGTEVYNNTIWVTNQTLLGGINLVDYLPWGGDLSRTVVRDNTIVGGFRMDDSSELGIIKIGIAIGPRIWFGAQAYQNVTTSGTVIRNRFSGAFMYGIAISSANNFVVQENAFFDNYTFIGGPGPECEYSGDIVPAPAPFIYDTSASENTLQPGFEAVATGELLTCMLAPAESVYWPVGTSPGSSAVARAFRDTPTSSSWTLRGLLLLFCFSCVALYAFKGRTRGIRVPKRNRSYPGLESPVAEVLARRVYARDLHLEKRRAF
ncbi:unnamed protein product [Mycena citricolor]|uniref:Right handed beta helix domain-containing protein n=1 Tax=Mycena citricolor TaxID=2018698 RepID=A0AAD2HHP3_9AGAR|nr:unnamed protein product [Mycena citricolor]